MSDEFDELEDFDDFDTDEFLAAWEEAERSAAQVVREGLAGVALPKPSVDEVTRAAAGLRTAWHEYDDGARWAIRAAAIDDPDSIDDHELLVRSVAATISMVESTGLPDEEEATIAALELADWVGAILGAVRAGPGGDASPAQLVTYVDECPEIEGEPLDDDDADFLEFAFRLVLPAWQAAGAIDERERVTRIGAWLLPAAAEFAWGARDGSA